MENILSDVDAIRCRDGAAFCVLGSMDCFSCFFAVSVFTDYTAGGSSRSIPFAAIQIESIELLP
jgi:hypothetical protein